MVDVNLSRANLGRAELSGADMTKAVAALTRFVATYRQKKAPAGPKWTGGRIIFVGLLGDYSRDSAARFRTVATPSSSTVTVT